MKLINNNRVRKYILYAIGEIFLVVIGILIALQINNWNNNRIQRKNERVILEQIKEDLNANIERFESGIRWEEQRISDISTLIETIKNSSPLNDTVKINFVWINNFEEFIFVSSGYESLRSIGFELISSDILRNSIIELYDNQYQTIAHRVDVYGRSALQTRQKYILQYFVFDDKINFMRPTNLSKLFDDKKFLALLKNRIFFKRYVVDWEKRAIEKTNNIINLIDENLK